MKEKFKWCFRIKDGAKIVRSNETISKSYINLAKNTLKSAENMLKEDDLLWTTVMSYYAEYYALYSFLARIGVKCENHFCSILITKFLLGKEMVESIEKNKDKRIDAQYYLRIVKKDKIKNMLNSAKLFVAEFEDMISKLNEKKITFFREKIKEILK